MIEIHDVHSSIFSDYVPKTLIPMVQRIGAKLEDLLPSPYAQEIIGKDVDLEFIN